MVPVFIYLRIETQTIDFNCICIAMRDVIVRMIEGFFKLSSVKYSKYCSYAIQKPTLMPMKKNFVLYVLTNG
jgi:hypothetical protein